MIAFIWILGLLAGTGTLLYFRAALWQWTLAFGLLLAGITLFGGHTPWVSWVIFILLAGLLNIFPLRRLLISDRLLGWFRKLLPPISETERVALEAGNTWWDAELFGGRPDWKKMLSYPVPALTREEQAFLDGPVEELCSMLDDWQISAELNDLPPKVWAYIKKHRFFGMIIPKEYGGLGFSALAHSSVVLKLATRSVSAAVTVMVPNSLGPGELLLLYGTEEQRRHYLPRLARGEEIPCFALTGPYVGSDAGALPDTGVVCKGQYHGKEVLGFRMNWDKRYITLAPIATLIGVAFNAYDPDHLLGDRENLGITLALVPSDTPGVETGKRHNPLNLAFQNGPTRGKDVFIPLDFLIGGTEYIGLGWRMLMNCLSVGRAISLPALGTGAGKHTSRVTGAYARIRKQFHIPVGKFEGVEEALTRIGGYTYRMEAARRMTAGALDQGERPSVLSAILKYHCTEGMRQVLNDSMDVHGGRGVVLGPRNYIGRAYQGIPISITVEGANILTRSMIIFGQGAIRCHPYLLSELEAAQDTDLAAASKKFDKALFAHAGFTVSNAIRTLWTGLSGALLVRSPDSGQARRYYRQFSRMSAAFAFVSDIALLILGGGLKRREKLSGRFADILSHLYMGSAMLKQFEDQGRPAADLPLLEWACQDSLFTIQLRMEDILRNFPNPVVGRLLRLIVFPLGRPFTPPKDGLGHSVASILMTPCAARDRLTRGGYHSNDPADPIGRVEHALEKTLAAEPIEARIEREFKVHLDVRNYHELVQTAADQSIITSDEAALLRDTFTAIHDAISVDEFTPQEPFEEIPVSEHVAG